MKVVICDDERAAAKYLNALLQKRTDIDVLGMFTNQKEFLEFMEDEMVPDIVFMDIDWQDDIDGIQLSKLLFEKYPNTQIIYVTGYNDRFSQQIFLEDSNLCGYLVKPVQEDLLERMLMRTENRRNLVNEKFVVSQRGVEQVFLYSEIAYLESKGHHVILHTEKEDISIYEKLDTCSKKLPCSFAQCHKSYVVNMDYIIYIDKDIIWLKNDKKINISKSKYKEFRERYFKYMGTKM
ncbi:MAG: response regulator transcription factor [Roseburia sp.]|nr:response regulator transcription factor [Roseburia sp.]